MPRHQVADVRNVALVGHGAVGKTTLADLLLFKSGSAPRAGSVADGTSLLDTDDEERHHKYTISSSMAHFTHEGKRVNFFDTPGYPDFIGQVIGTFRAVETAVIALSAGSGIEVNTRRCFQKAGEAGLGRMVLVTKCDLENIRFDELTESIRETFGAACVPVNLPIGLGHELKGVCCTLNPPATKPEGCVADPTVLNRQLMDAIVEADADLMEKYFEGTPLTADEIAAGMHKAIASGTLIPVLFMSARQGIGVDEFMNFIARNALSPLDLPRKAENGAGDVALVPDASAPLVGQVFKTKIDPFVGRMSYVRIYQGTLHKDESLHTSSAAKNVKSGPILDVQGAKTEPIDAGGPGDIVAIVKVDELKLGDTITKANGLHMSAVSYPTPMIGLAVEPKSRNDQQKISGALHKIEEEDPTFQVFRDAQTHEIVIRGMSELHLQIAREKLLKRDKVEVNSHAPKIAYHETVAGAAEGSYRHKKQSGGSGQFAEVHFKVSALPQGIVPEEYFTAERFPSIRQYHYDATYNFAFVDRVTGGSVPNNFIPAIEKGVHERLEQGVLAGFHVQDCVVELFFGKDHPVDSNETAFKIAGNQCFKEVFLKARPSLLEPIVHLEITVPGEKLGDVTSDLNGRRGRVEGMDGAPGGFQVVHARAPLSEVMTYARSLSSLTGGQGSFTLDFSHYEAVPPNEQQKIVAAHARHEEEAHAH